MVDDFRGVIDAHFFKPQIEEPKAERSATEMGSQTSDYAFSGILAGARCFALTMDWSCSTTDQLALSPSRSGLRGIHWTPTLVGALGGMPLTCTWSHALKYEMS